MVAAVAEFGERKKKCALGAPSRDCPSSWWPDRSDFDVLFPEQTPTTGIVTARFAFQAPAC